MSPINLWPLFGLRVLTPTVELRYPNDDDIAEIAERSAIIGVHQQGYMPFTVPWTEVDPPLQQRNTMQHHWSLRSNWRPEQWTCNFVVVLDGDIVGAQGAGATDFGVLRSALTGSYLLTPYQGRGLGKEMRAAILHLLFAGLGAELAETAAFDDNDRSIGVTRSLGYEFQGRRRVLSQGASRDQLLFRLARAEWESRRRDDIEIVGLAPCLELFGVYD